MYEETNYPYKQLFREFLYIFNDYCAILGLDLLYQISSKSVLPVLELEMV